MSTPEDKKHWLYQAYAGDDLALDSLTCSLHDMTQIAVALQPGADLVIRNAATMTPIERASIACVGKGRVLFF